MTVKAIQTSYAGCRFRSRTEARWAVLFDALGIKWEYEREGFELPSGKYLPDFWLPEFETWVEVKGGQPSEAEGTKARDLAEVTGQPVLIVCGVPEIESDQVWLFIPGARPVKCFLASRGNAVTCRLPRYDRTYWLSLPMRKDTRLARTTNFLATGMIKARSARFEHGEKP